MRRLVVLIGLLALALLGAWLWHWVARDPGYVLVALNGYSIETTLVVAVAAWLVLWIALWLLLLVVRFPLRYLDQRRKHQSRECLAGGLVALHEGRWRRAEKLLRRAAREPQHRFPALLGAARAAQQRGDDGNAESLLAEAASEHDPLSVALLRARQHQRRGEFAEVTALFDAEPVAALPPRALEIYLHALTETGRAREAVALLPALRSSQVLEGAALEAREAQIIALALQQSIDDETLGALWSPLSRRQKAHARIVAAYARRALDCGETSRAVEAVEKSLRTHWSPELIAVYSLLPRGGKRSPLKMAETWLTEHPNDVDLLIALGRLCRNEQLWGKAEDYINRALALGAKAPAWEELGHIHAAQHQDARAREAYAKALAALRNERAATPVALSLRDRIAGEAVVESRSSMGLPQLGHDPDPLDPVPRD
ncbi:MAG TPA: heme biosynthesis HemY N-terminal domain-containing protein [Chiayiivirga sp.]|nr:heme biosynthesis HemY N-terminal domain-containing protein [Chiayiivirga sp.]